MNNVFNIINESKCYFLLHQIFNNKFICSISYSFAFISVLCKFILETIKIMKKLILSITILISFTVSIFPQESSFYDAPFGGGIGYTPFWYVPKVSALNSQLKAFDFPQIPSGGFYSSGFGGFIYLGVIPNLRLGGVGFGGSVSDKSNDAGIQKETKFSLSGGGLTVEYTLPFIRAFAVSVGAVIGAGSMQVEIYKNTGGMSWDELLQDASGQSSNIMDRVLKDNYWIFSPTVNADIPAYRMLSFRVGIGYQITFGNKWTFDNSMDLSGAPAGIDGKSFFVQAGILVGLFSF